MLLAAFLLNASSPAHSAENSLSVGPKKDEGSAVAENSIPSTPNSRQPLSRPRPRTLAAARSENCASTPHAATNALATSDASLVHVIQHRWLQLLGQSRALPQRGKVRDGAALHLGDLHEADPDTGGGFTEGAQVPA